MNWQQLLLGTTADVDIEPYLEFQQYAILLYVERDGRTIEQAGGLLSLDKEQSKKIYKDALKNLELNRDLIISNSVESIKAEKENEKLKNELHELKEKIKRKIEINEKIILGQRSFYSTMCELYAIKELGDLLNE